MAARTSHLCGETMDDIRDVRTSDCVQSDYIKMLRCSYVQNGSSKTWDLVSVHSSVAILIFNVTRNVLVFVRQFRPAVYYNGIPAEERGGPTIDTTQWPPSAGVTLELCAGIVDKEVDLVDIARTEVLEECGYDVPRGLLRHISTYRCGVGIAGERQTLFYAEVTDAMRVTSGGGNPSEGELIEVVEMSVDQVRKYVDTPEVNSTTTFLFGVTWFLSHHKMALTIDP